MDIAIVGYGAMGRIIERIAKERGHFVKTFDTQCKADYCEIKEETMKDIDVAIDFTHPSAAVENIKKYCKIKVNAVIGTTGWYDKLEEVRKEVKKSNIGFIYSPNFSVGVNIFFRLTKEISKMMNNFEEYTVTMSEAHHTRKKDAPSGTAKMLAEIIKNNASRIGDIEIKSIREGDIPGTHTINFESKADIIKLEHEAKNREGFGLGAVMAAEWIKDKKGFFTIEDFMKEIIK